MLCRLPFVQVKRMYRCRRYPGCCLNREAQAAARGIMSWPVRGSIAAAVYKGALPGQYLCSAET
jgi:hypothetical protein